MSMLAPKPSHTTSDASDPVPLSTMPLLAQAMVAVLRPRRKKTTIVKVPLVKMTMKTKNAKVPLVKMTMKTKIAKVPNAQMMTKRTRTMTMTKKYQTAPPPWLPPPLLLSSSLPLSSDQIENRV